MKLRHRLSSFSSSSVSTTTTTTTSPSSSPPPSSSTKHYSQLWTLASNKIFSHFRQSLIIAFFYSHSVIFKSSSTSTLHLLHGLHLFVVPSGVAADICFDIHWLCILSTWPLHLSRRDFVNLQYLPLVIYIPSPCYFLFSIVLLLLRIHLVSLKSTVQAFWASSFFRWLLSRVLTRKPVLVVLGR